MAGGKRLEGERPALAASVFGLGSCSPTYDQFVQLYLNVPALLDAADFHRTVSHLVALGGQQLPDEWIAAANPHNSEASRWRQWDLRRTARG